MFRIVTSVEIYLVAVFFDCFFHNNTENTFGILKEGKCKETDNLIYDLVGYTTLCVFTYFQKFLSIFLPPRGALTLRGPPQPNFI